ncbi:hypothetical protein [Deinococcus sp.]|uniref:hypothetical protein n=1 Tax=Deinococcus sp. TaxID=47478 RepID=UPI0025FF19A5|nr:hypothetical protein [Deinococcus sp.]
MAAGQHWREVWHRAQDGEQLSDIERRELDVALADPDQYRETQRWAQVAALLRHLSAPAWPGSHSRSMALDRQVQQSAAPPALPATLAPELAADIALSARLGPAAALPHSLVSAVVARIVGETQSELSFSSAREPEAGERQLTALLRGSVVPPPPGALAGASAGTLALNLAARISREAAAEVTAAVAAASAQPSQGGPAQVTWLRPPRPTRLRRILSRTPHSAALPPLGRTRFNPPGGPSAIGGAAVVLAFGGLTVLRGNGATRQIMSLLGSAAPFGTQFSLPLPTILGVLVLALLSWLIVARPTPAVRRYGAVGLAVTGVLTLPALWDALQQTPLRFHLAALGAASPSPHLLVERWLGAGLLLLVTAALLRGGQAARLGRRQRHSPVQTLAAGTLAGLGLAGLGLLLLSFGLSTAGLVLGVLSAGAVLTGLSVSLSAAGRSVARRLGLALPEVSGALAGVLAFSATLSVPALAALLAVVGGVWGLGTLLLGPERAQA